MKNLVLIIFSLIYLTAKSQKAETFQCKYKYQTGITLPGLESVKDLNMVSDVTVYNNGSLMLIAMEPFKGNSPGLTISGEDKADTLFCDLQKNIVYDLNNGLAYNYLDFNFNFQKIVGDTTASFNGNTITFSKKLSNKVTAIPRLDGLPFGMTEFKSGNTTLTLVGYKKSDFSLKSILQRVQFFEISEKPYNWLF